MFPARGKDGEGAEQMLLKFARKIPVDMAVRLFKAGSDPPAYPGNFHSFDYAVDITQ
jgi:hypothetical protein